MRKVLFMAVLCMVCASGAGAKKHKTVSKIPTQQPVYIFGFAASFTDSAAYMTDIQLLDSAYVYENGFLADRPLYSAQLAIYLQDRMDRADMTCAVFFNKDKRKLEKTFLKVRRKYRADPAVTLSALGVDVFQFQVEEWIEPMEMELPPDMPEPGKGPGPGGEGGPGGGPGGGMGGPGGSMGGGFGGGMGGMR